MQSVISPNHVLDRSNRHVIRFIHHSNQVLARCSVPAAIPLNVAFEGHFHLINIQAHIYKNVWKSGGTCKGVRSG